jgi:hypothetical protein
VGDRSRGRFATYADLLLHDCSPYSHVHVRRECLGFVPRSRAIFCRPVPNPKRYDSPHAASRALPLSVRVGMGVPCATPPHVYVPCQPPPHPFRRLNSRAVNLFLIAVRAVGRRAAAGRVQGAVRGGGGRGSLLHARVARLRRRGETLPLPVRVRVRVGQGAVRGGGGSGSLLHARVARLRRRGAGAMKKLRIVILRFGTARQKPFLE